MIVVKKCNFGLVSLVNLGVLLGLFHDQDHLRFPFCKMLLDVLLQLGSLSQPLRGLPVRVEVVVRLLALDVLDRDPVPAGPRHRDPVHEPEPRGHVEDDPEDLGKDDCRHLPKKIENVIEIAK